MLGADLPILAELLSAPTATTMLALLGAELLLAIALWQAGRRWFTAGSAGREAADLFVLPAVLRVVQLALLGVLGA